MASWPIYDRWQYPTVCEALTKRRVVVLSGARQCGKTSLAEMFDKGSVLGEFSLSNQMRLSDNTIYRSLDDVALLNAAKDDPKGFVAHGNGLMIIDEIQRVPDLLLAIKHNVDQNKNPGRFLLTGSANIQQLPGVIESLAGRVFNVRLRPLSQGELLNAKPSFLDNAYQQTFPISNSLMPQDKNEYLTKALDGGYPEILRFHDRIDKYRWFDDYIQAIIDRDLQNIVNIQRRNAMLELLQVMAAWSSKFMDISKIGSQLALSRPSIESYINALELLYLVERLHPWTKSDYDRVSKQDKVFMTDTGLMASLLKWRYDDVLLNQDRKGKLIETFVFNQLMAICESQREDIYQCYHYRDREKREIDFIVENMEGNILAIEVKSGSNVNKDSFKHIRWFQETLVSKDKQCIGIVLYTGDHVVPFGKNNWAVPINAMWS